MKIDKNGFPVPNVESELNLSEGTEIVCGGKSVNILTTAVSM